MPEINNLYDHIIMAQREAQRQGISANVVAINDKIAFSKLRCATGADIPMICGLKCVYTEELPEEMTFAVFRAENPPLTLYEENEMLRREIRELKSKFERIIDLIGGGAQDA